MERHGTNKKDKLDTNTQSGRTGGRVTGAQICGMILHGERAARLLPSTQAGSRTVQSNAWKKQFNGRTDRQRRTLSADTPPRSPKHVNSAKVGTTTPQLNKLDNDLFKNPLRKSLLDDLVENLDIVFTIRGTGTSTVARWSAIALVKLTRSMGSAVCLQKKLIDILEGES